MTPDDKGLPLPPFRPAAASSSTGPRPDLLPGVVGDGLAGIAQDSQARIGHFDDALKQRAKAGTEFSPVVPFTERGPDELAHVPSFLEKSVGDPAAAGLLKTLGGSLLHGAGSPVQAIADEVWAAPKVRKAQQDFLDENGATLQKMGENLGKAKRALRTLSAMKPAFHAREMRDLLDRKRSFGNDALSQIDQSIASASDSDERAKLQASRNELSGWMRERDERVAMEQGEVGTLTNRIDAVESRVYKQRGILENAAGSEGPRNLVIDGKVAETSHHRPDALGHAISLQDLFRASKASIDGAITAK